MISEGVLKCVGVAVSAGNTGEEHNLKVTGKRSFTGEKNLQILSKILESECVDQSQGCRASLSTCRKIFPISASLFGTLEKISLCPSL